MMKGLSPERVACEPVRPRATDLSSLGNGRNSDQTTRSVVRPMSSIGYVSHHDEHDMGKSGIAQLTMRSDTQLL